MEYVINRSDVYYFSPFSLSTFRNDDLTPKNIPSPTGPHRFLGSDHRQTNPNVETRSSITRWRSKSRAKPQTSSQRRVTLVSPRQVWTELRFRLGRAFNPRASATLCGSQRTRNQGETRILSPLNSSKNLGSE